MPSLAPPHTFSRLLSPAQAVLSDEHCNRTAGERPVLNAHTVYTALMNPHATGGEGDEALRAILRDPTRDGLCSEGP